MAGALHSVRNKLSKSLPWKRQSEEGNVVLPTRTRYGRARTTQPVTLSISNIDQALVCALAALLLWGLIMVYSASIALGDNPGRSHLSPTFFLYRHIFGLLMGVVAAVLAFQIRTEVWEKWARWLFVFAVFLLILVLVPGIGKGVNGARRWIPLGVMNFQPSELAKVAVVLYAADFIRRRMEVQERERQMGEIKRFFHAVWPMLVAVGGVGVLLMAEPDMGAFIVVAVIAMGILFLGGVNAKMFFAIATVLVGAFVLMIATSSWRRERVFAYLDPWSPEHALGKGYQLSHALIAIGRGEFFGVGLGGSVEKLHWLPEAHTDFLLSVLGEEFGFVGIFVLIVLFMWLVRRIVQIGRQAIALDRTFAGLAAQGVGLWLGFQALINIGVNLGALPTKGLTLPLMSYGGSAILMNMVALGIVLRIDYENRIVMKGGSL